VGKFLTEQQVLKQLEISDFRHMTKDKVMSFASMLQSMDPEVAKRALAQFPEFSKMALAAMKEYKSVVEKTLDADSESARQFNDMCDKVIDALAKCMEKDDLTVDEILLINERMTKVLEMAAGKDSESKRFKLTTLITLAGVVVIVVGTAASALGGNVNIKMPQLPKA